MSRVKRQELIDNIVAAMQSVPQAIQARQIGHFLKADPAYGRGIAAALGINISDSESAA